MKLNGWYEKYSCGCHSKLVARKSSLTGKCKIHKASRVEVNPVVLRSWKRDPTPTKDDITTPNQSASKIYEK